MFNPAVAEATVLEGVFNELKVERNFQAAPCFSLEFQRCYMVNLFLFQDEKGLRDRVFSRCSIFQKLNVSQSQN